MRKIIYTRTDGGLSVVVPVINTVPVLENITEAQAEQRAWNALPKDAIAPRFVTDADIPADRAFRDAWGDSGAAIVVDMVKAKAIHRARIRAKRSDKFPTLDAVWMKATAAGDAITASDCEAKRQLLRDAPAYPAIAAATTPDELKAAMPPILSQ